MTPPSTAAPDTTAQVDLHVHSTASDGSRAPADVVQEARRVGLAAIALTDHDTVDGVAEAANAGSAIGVRVVPGVELSAVEGDVETHILGLHLSDTRELEARLVGLRDMRRTRAERIVQRLNELGVRIAIADVLEQAAGGAIGRPHVARAMIANGWAVDFRDAFDRYLGNGKPAFVSKDRLAVADAIELIHRAGGLAILAHPAQAGTRERVQAFAALGIDGVEVRHPSHSAEDAARLAALVEHFGLVPSGGSDWHGSGDGPRTLGAMRVPAEWLSRQDGRVRARAA
ncbi:MAG TPA: PHP domain-containing protein [Gemmatimonadaceae bacterium]|nr:PHP domain-containing protein [Gemmatimonadaceae bacterium]